MVQASYKDAPWSAPTRALSGMSHRMETQGQNQDPLERLYLTLALGKSVDPPKEELEFVARDRKVHTVHFSLLPPLAKNIRKMNELE